MIVLVLLSSLALPSLASVAKEHAHQASAVTPQPCRLLVSGKLLPSAVPPFVIAAGLPCHKLDTRESASYQATPVALQRGALAENLPAGQAMV